jgi:hypothetical protein
MYINKNERQIIQDLLLTLQGNSNSTFEYDEEKKCFQFIKKVQVAHLSPFALE